MTVTMKRIPLWILAALFCALLWGSASPGIKLGYAFFHLDTNRVANIILYAGLRFAGAGLITILLCPLFTKRRERYQTGILPAAVKLGLVQTVLQYLLFYLGLRVVSGAVGALLTSMNIFFTTLISTVLLRIEPPSPRKYLACLLGLLGLLVLNLQTGFHFAFRLDGEGFVLLAALANAAANLMIRAYGQRFNPMLLNGYQFLFSGLLMSLIGLVFGADLGRPNLAAWGLMLYLMLLSVLAYGIWALLLAKYPPSDVVIFHSAVPIFGSLFSWLMLGEAVFNLRFLLALALVAGGILLANLRRQRLRSERG